MSETGKRGLVVETHAGRHHFDATGYTVQADGGLDVWAGPGIAAASFAPGWACVWYEDAKPQRETPAA